MSVLLPIAVVLACAGAAYVGALVVIPQLRKRCPACGSRALRSTDSHRGTGVDEQGRRAPFLWTEYRCEDCSAEFREKNRDGLVTREAWDAGARSPLPTATIVDRE